MKSDARGPVGKVMGGAPLRVCPRCSSLQVAQFCGRCGERIEMNGEYWAALLLEVTPRSAASKLKPWQSFPGRWEPASGGVRMFLEGPHHLVWVRENIYKSNLERFCSIEGPSGQRVATGTPVYHCMTRVMESNIRGCMTQRFRVPHCGDESTLLPLHEDSKTLSLGDLLIGGGFGQIAADLVAGVLWELSQSRHKVDCPLFGRALKLGANDMEALPFAVSDLVEERKRGPLVRLWSERESVQASRLQRPVEVGSGINLGRVRPSSPEWVCRWGSQGLVTSGQTASESESLWTSGERSQFMSGGFLVRSLGPAVTAQHEGAQGGTVTALVLPDRVRPAPDMHFPFGLQGVDVSGQHMAGLWVGRNRLTTRVVGPDSDGVPWSFTVGPLPASGWGLRMADPNVLLAWNPSGALVVLTSHSGWLLSPAELRWARFRGPMSRPEFVGVVAAVRPRAGQLAVLSSLGHRLTVLEVDRTKKWPEPPLVVATDAILPLKARGLTTFGPNALALEDTTGGYVLSVDGLRVLAAIPAPAGGRVVAADGGGLLRCSPDGWTWYPPPRQTEPAQAEFLQTARGFGDRPPQPTVLRPVLDRFDNLPHKPTWGG